MDLKHVERAFKRAIKLGSNGSLRDAWVFVYGAELVAAAKDRDALRDELALVTGLGNEADPKEYGDFIADLTNDYVSLKKQVQMLREMAKIRPDMPLSRAMREVKLAARSRKE